MGELKTHIRVQAEGTGIIAKTAVTFLAIQVGLRQSTEEGSFALLSFAAGQISYALVVLGIYMRSFGLGPLVLKLKGKSVYVQYAHSMRSPFHMLHIQHWFFSSQVHEAVYEYELSIDIQASFNGRGQIPDISNQSTGGSRWICSSKQLW
jgi:hypothetical protein